MVFGHLTLPVSDWVRSRDWYVESLGLKIEFEIPEHRTAAVQDQDGFTIFLQQADNPIQPTGLALTFRVDDVEATHRDLVMEGVAFTHAPQKVFWGSGAELRDPDGYIVRLWDELSMKEGV